MGKAKYMLKRLTDMHYDKMFETAGRVAKKTGRNRIAILVDIIHCGIKYMAGYVDYEVFEFYDLTPEQRASVVTRGVNNRYVQVLNGNGNTAELDNKILFDKRFDKYLNREWLYLKECTFEDFQDFFTRKKTAIAKPVDMACGRGVIKIEYNEGDDVKAVYDSLMANGQTLVEEYIVQHPEMSRMYPCSVNTMRIVTINKDGVVHIMFRSLRIGNSGYVVDNLNHGGLFSTIDEDGVIRKPAVDKAGNIYENHPYTGTPVVGFKIPKFQEAMEYVKALAAEKPDVGLVGWDIAITENGPVVVEANPFPGHDIYYSIVHRSEDKMGLKPEFDKIIFG
jgi:hypothetical protein